MATIRKEIVTRASAAAAWSAMRDVGALHTRLVKGFVVDTRLDGDCRIVTFGNGYEARERIVAIDERLRRVAYSVVGGLCSHHHASAEIVVDGDGSRVIWTCDLLPDSVAPTIEAMMDQGARAMQQTLDAVTLDAVTLDAVTLDAVTLDAVTLDAVTLDAVTIDAANV